MLALIVAYDKSKLIGKDGYALVYSWGAEKIPQSDRKQCGYYGEKNL